MAPEEQIMKDRLQTQLREIIDTPIPGINKADNRQIQRYKEIVSRARQVNNMVWDSRAVNKAKDVEYEYRNFAYELRKRYD